MDEEKLGIEDLKVLRKFKLDLFQNYWDNSVTFYAHVLPHPSLEIGKRGLVGEEKTSGIILAFGQTACREVASEADYLFAELQFGYTWEKLFIPWDAVYRLYDKNQFVITQMRVQLDKIDFGFGNSEPKAEPVKKKKAVSDSKVIEVDFGAKRK